MRVGKKVLTFCIIDITVYTDTQKGRIMDKKLVMRISEELHKELKTYAFLKNLTMTEYIMSLIIEDEKNRKKVIDAKMK